MRAQFTESIRSNQNAFAVELADDAIERLADYYRLVQENNPLLHLVAPCPPEEFATRHVLESLTLLEYLPDNAGFADVGTGAGLPSIPCLLVREDLKATLIESKEKKAEFLNSALERLSLTDRATIVNRQFSETHAGGAQFVTSRALDKLTQKLPQLRKWSGRRRMLLFGGESLRESLQAKNARFVQKLMPLSERRFLFVVEP
jgi:16S rRNA (guanine527-N7)-methyltransferase